MFEFEKCPNCYKPYNGRRVEAEYLPTHRNPDDWQHWVFCFECFGGLEKKRIKKFKIWTVTQLLKDNS